ncbi:MAG: Rid family detoxifying hydrolase [Nanoarchaeota archaeon]|nr:Rid family detoxifying hydrolase [Nanoarchaeota archaeon]
MKKTIGQVGSFPISKAVLIEGGSIMEISGQIGTDSSGKLSEGIENQTKQSLENVKKILEEVGWNLDNIVKVRVYLVDMKDYGKVNEVYSKYFTKEFPARVALAVKELPLGALVEIECVASK